MQAYAPPTVTVDGVVFRLDESILEVLLIQRAHEPFQGAWALPGAYCSRDETTTDALYRTLAQKAGVAAADLQHVEQLYTFDVPAAQDPRGHAVSVIYMGLGREVVPAAEAAERPRFFPVDQLPSLAYQHTEIIGVALQRLRSKITYTNIAFSLLPERFTLGRLQSAYEAVLGHPLDKRNFRKKIQLLDIIEPTDAYDTGGAHRPARLYRFTHDSLQAISRSLE